MPSSRLSCRNRSMTSRLVCESRFPVGSSARRIGGSLARARAMATRCCWPPESCEGWWSMRDSRPTFFSSCRTRSRRWLPRSRPAVEQRQFHVLQGAGPRQQIEALEHEADLPVPQAGPLVARHLDHLFALQQVTAAGGAIEAAERVHQRRLSGARGAHQGHVFAAVDVQRDALQGVDLDFAERVGLADVAQLDQRHFGSGDRGGLLHELASDVREVGFLRARNQRRGEFLQYTCGHGRTPRTAAGGLAWDQSAPPKSPRCRPLVAGLSSISCFGTKKGLASN